MKSSKKINGILLICWCLVMIYKSDHLKPSINTPAVEIPSLETDVDKSLLRPYHPLDHENEEVHHLS